MTKRKASVALETGNESNQSTSTQDNNSNSNSIVGPNNNSSQANQNGSSGSGSDSCRQQQVGENSNGVQHKNKKERADNWSSAEIQVLHRGIESRREIFYGPQSQASKKNRELAWDAITKEVNAVSTAPRSLSQVMKKFKNEKCRAKRKFVDSEKDDHSSMASNNGDTGNNNNNNVVTGVGNGQNLSNQNLNTNNQQLQQQSQQSQQQQLQQQQPQSHQMTNSDATISSQPSINVVKLAPQNVAKTMIDLPGHVQQIQMPNDDMVLIVPQEMDGLLSGMNIVSDALSNQQHNHHGQHTIQAINAGPSLVNGTMGNGMMARTIPAGSMCSLVYSTGGEICGPDQHVTSGLTGTNQLSGTNPIGVNAQNLMHHRGSIEQGHQHPHHHQSHPHHQQQQQQQHQQHQPQHQQQSSQQQGHQQHQPQHQQPHPHQMHHHQNHLQQNHLAPASSLANTNNVAAESQLKNLLFNLLLKQDGQHSMSSAVSTNHDYNKNRNDMLAVIASSLNKIEGHLSKISKVATSYFTSGANGGPSTNVGLSNSTSLSQSSGSLSLNANDSNNNAVQMSGSTSTISGQRVTEA